MTKISASAEAQFAAALKPKTPERKLPHLVPMPQKEDPNAIPLGQFETNSAVTVALDLVKLLEGRLLIQGASGAGKSWTIRRLLEKSAGRIQQIVIDPEGEFRSLAEELGYLHVESHKFDSASLSEMARRARQHRLSLVLDLSERTREEQMIAVAAFFHALIECPSEMWHPALVAIDEAHLFAPFGGQSSATTAVRKAAIGAVVDLMSRGRKRGLAGILATQRLARLSKSVASEVHNFLVGMNTLDVDIRRAGETIGWDMRKAYDRLPMLRPGEFIAVGPAFPLSPAGVIVGEVRSRHIGAAPALSAPEKIGAAQATALLDLEQLEQASADAAADEASSPGYKAVRTFIRDISFPLAGRVFAALHKLMPEGAAIGDMAAHFEAGREEIVAALALLSQFNAVEISGDAARIAHKFYHGVKA